MGIQRSPLPIQDVVLRKNTSPSSLILSLPPKRQVKGRGWVWPSAMESSKATGEISKWKARWGGDPLLGSNFPSKLRIKAVHRKNERKGALWTRKNLKRSFNLQLTKRSK